MWQKTLVASKSNPLYRSWLRGLDGVTMDASIHYSTKHEPPCLQPTLVWPILRTVHKKTPTVVSALTFEVLKRPIRKPCTQESPSSAHWDKTYWPRASLKALHLLVFFPSLNIKNILEESNGLEVFTWIRESFLFFLNNKWVGAWGWAYGMITTTTKERNKMRN